MDHKDGERRAMKWLELFQKEKDLHCLYELPRIRHKEGEGRKAMRMVQMDLLCSVLDRMFGLKRCDTYYGGGEAVSTWSETLSGYVQENG